MCYIQHILADVRPKKDRVLKRTGTMVGVLIGRNGFEQLLALLAGMILHPNSALIRAPGTRASVTPQMYIRLRRSERRSRLI